MRKAASTGTLRKLAEGKSGDVGSHGRCQPLMRKSGSSGGLSSTGRHKKVSSDNDLRQMGSLPTPLQRTSVRTQATAHFAPPPAMEVAEDVVEASFARGLASAECFELYGPVRKAPPLMEAASPEDAATGAGSLQQLPAGAAQQMAACLATPFTGTDKNMGEILRSEVDRLNANQELQTQLRYAEELRQKQGSEEEEKDEQDALLKQSGRQRRVRMRRRSSDELMETQLLQEFGIAGGGRPLPPGRPAEPHSPETRVALDLLYASMDDNTNRLTLDEAELGKVSADVTKDDYIFPMELGEPEQALKTSATRGRTFINITAHSAPSPA